MNAHRLTAGAAVVVLSIAVIIGCSAPGESREAGIKTGIEGSASAGQEVSNQGSDPQRIKDGTEAWRSDELVGNGILTKEELAQARALWGSRVGLAVVGLDGGLVAGFEGQGVPYAWSTTKLLLVTQLLIESSGPEGIPTSLSYSVERALTASDNESAAEVNAWLKSRYGGPERTAERLTEVLREAGDKRTTIRAGQEENSNYGLSQWDVQSQARFFSELSRGCVLDPRSTGFLLGVLGQVVQEQSWGLGGVGATSFKGGWGAKSGESAFQVRQVGLVRAPDGNEYVLAISVWPSAETYEDGQVLVAEVANWAVANIESAPEAVDCTN